MYSSINEIHADKTLFILHENRLAGLENIEPRTISVFKSKQVLKAGYIFPVLAPRNLIRSENVTEVESPFSVFIERLKEDGGKVLQVIA